MALQIIEKYRKPEAKQDDYVFPILDRRIHKTAIQIRDKVRKANKAANKALHRIGEKLGDDLAVILFFIGPSQEPSGIMGPPLSMGPERGPLKI